MDKSLKLHFDKKTESDTWLFGLIYIRLQFYISYTSHHSDMVWVLTKTVGWILDEKKEQDKLDKNQHAAVNDKFTEVVWCIFFILRYDDFFITFQVRRVQM